MGQGACFALLDDGRSAPGERRSRLYRGYAGTLTCAKAGELPALWHDLEQAWQRGLHALALFSYELGADMQGIAPREGAAPSTILLFEQCERLTAEEVTAWLETQDDAPAGVMDVRPSVDEAQFAAAIARIRDWIEAGDTYQVNYTYRLRFAAYGSALALYRRLRARQPVPYGAFVALPDGGAVLSFSPELFIRSEGGIVTTQPMKGTAPAIGEDAQDAVRAQELAADEKNRAENLMIVDLLRNDLGRVAETGSVRVPRLFEVARHGRVLQMTSTVSATLREDCTLSGLFAALYPCGSITGAPKRRTMQLIRELESTPRALYTGAIGWIEPPSGGHGVGDLCLSVPIRTLVLRPPRDGLREGEMGVGAGIVHDSDAQGELAECRVKAGFLTGLTHEFELFETMFATRAGGCRHLDAHLQRLRTSAARFDFAYDEARVHRLVQQACEALPSGAHRLRLALRQSGESRINAAPLSPQNGPVRVLLAQEPTHAADPLLRHKTTVRARYDAAWREAEARGAFDMLFFNAQGELTEGGRSNVFVRLDGQWYTPPVECGLLPGVMRAVLLADPAWQAREKRLTRDDLRQAEDVVVCNALRGALSAQVEWD